MAAGMTMALGTAACEQNGAPTPEAQRTMDNTGHTLERAGHGAVHGVESVGHGIVYGAREVGQTLSGTQGDPQAEALSNRAREHMAEHANEADRDFGRTPASDEHVNDRPSTTSTTTTPNARGGGRIDRTE